MNYFIKVLSEITGVQYWQMKVTYSAIMTDLSSTKKKYDKIAYALEEVKY